MEKILLVRLDAIGDYILFRNILRFIRNSKKYQKAHLTILGNPAWKNIAETFDADCADEWIWLANCRQYFRTSIENLMPYSLWHPRVLKRQSSLRTRLLAANYDEVISLHLGEDAMLDALLSGLAPNVIGVKAESRFGEGYTKLLHTLDQPFVFLRNCAVASALTGETCATPLSLAPLVPTQKQNAVMLHLGASHWTRRWPLSHCKTLCRMILTKTNARIVLAGGPESVKRAKLLSSTLDSDRVVIEAGKGSLVDFINSVSSMKAVVSNDTSSLHIAAAVGVPVVGIANGYSGRNSFWPYPDSLHKRVTVLTPQRIRPLPFVLPLAQIQQFRALSTTLPCQVFEFLDKFLQER